MSRWTGCRLLMAVVVLSGCGQRGPAVAWGSASHTSSGYNEGTEFAYSTETITRNGSPRMVIVVNDGQGSRTSSNRQGGEGVIRLRDQSNLAWSYRTTANDLGQVIVDGREVDLAKGGLLFVDASSKPAKIEQLDVDLTTIRSNAVLDDLVSQNRGNSRVVEFIEQCQGKAKGLAAARGEAKGEQE